MLLPLVPLFYAPVQPASEFRLKSHMYRVSGELKLFICIPLNSKTKKKTDRSRAVCVRTAYLHDVEPHEQREEGIAVDVQGVHPLHLLLHGMRPVLQQAAVCYPPATPTNQQTEMSGRVVSSLSHPVNRRHGASPLAAVFPSTYRITYPFNTTLG